MKVRTFEHKIKVKKRISLIFVMTTWLGFFWWIDSLEMPFLESWGEQLNEVHFLPRIVVIILYFSMLMVIIHYYWKLIAWIVGKLIDKYY